MKVLIISSAALPAPVQDGIDYKPLSPHINKMVLKQFGVTNCKICGKQYQKPAPLSVACSPECRKENDIQIKKSWDEKNKEHVVEYSKNYQSINHKLRKKRRQELYEKWGKYGRIYWDIAEKIAIDVLKKEGYQNIIHLSDIEYNSTYDILAVKDCKINFFQVTTRTHTEKKIQHEKALKVGALHKVVFISIKMKKYLIKDFTVYGSVELNQHDIENLNSYEEISN